jgi:hypothetical protein
VQWSGQRRTIERSESILAVQKLDSRTGLKAEPITAADLFQEMNRVMVTGHEEVLAIVDHIATDGIDERISAASQMPAALQQNDLRAAAAQLDGGGKPGKSSSDYNDAL